MHIVPIIKNSTFLIFYYYHVECGIEIAFIWDIIKLSIRYTCEIIDVGVNFDQQYEICTEPDSSTTTTLAKYSII